MKNFMMIFATAIITTIIVVVIMVCKFGAVNVTNHTDHYVTTCNGEVISSEYRNVTDEVNFDVNVSERFNIFSR